MFKRKKGPKNKTDESFYQRIYQVVATVAKKPHETSGIYVLEHKEIGEFDSEDRKKIEMLRIAHEKWMERNRPTLSSSLEM